MKKSFVDDNGTMIELEPFSGLMQQIHKDDQRSFQDTLIEWHRFGFRVRSTATTTTTTTTITTTTIILTDSATNATTITTAYTNTLLQLLLLLPLQLLRQDNKQKQQ